MARGKRKRQWKRSKPRKSRRISKKAWKKRNFRRKKNRQARHESKLERRHRATAIHGTDMIPDAVLMKMRWTNYVQPTATAVSTALFNTITLNSLYDPMNTVSVAGNNARSWPTLAGLYYNNIVRACKVKLYALPRTTSTSLTALPCQFLWWIDNEPSNPTWGNISAVKGTHFAYLDVISIGGAATGKSSGPRENYLVLKKYINIKKYLKGFNEEMDKCITNGTTIANNPRRPVFLHWVFYNSDDVVTVQFNWSAHIKFYTKWWNKTTQYNSVDANSATSTIAADYPVVRPGE